MLKRDLIIDVIDRQMGVKLKCAVCGKDFINKSGRGKYCSKECRKMGTKLARQKRQEELSKVYSKVVVGKNGELKNFTIAGKNDFTHYTWIENGKLLKHALPYEESTLSKKAFNYYLDTGQIMLLKKIEGE